MKPDSFTPDSPGRVVRVGQPPLSYWAFLPGSLPPTLDLAPLAALLEDAGMAVGDLRGAGSQLPNPLLFIRPFVRREAVLSSRIEGTEASLSDLLFFEAAPEENPRKDDVLEVVNYVAALEWGMRQMGETPLGLHLVRELHRILMTGVRGKHATPGQFRSTQNWIGPPGCTLNEATFVPPPMEEMKISLFDWERFLREQPQGLPLLIQAALLHYQFEVIHPFIDGNGRVGRLLVTLFLAERGVLPQPLLYLSAFFERHRDSYYDALLRVSTHGDWQGWVGFFLRGARSQAREAVARMRELLALKSRYTEIAKTHGRAAGGSFRLVEALFQNPATTARRVQADLEMSFPAAQSAIERWVKAGVLQEMTGQQRGRVYVANEILRLIAEERQD